MAFLRHSHSEADTTKIAHDIAQLLHERITHDGAPVCLCLNGTLGAGKTFIARQIIRYLFQAPNMDVPSPTYTLVQYYEAPSLNYPITHFDLYRLDNEEDIFDLGWDDATAEGISIIEWSEKAKQYLPSKSIIMTIEISDNTRTVSSPDL